MSNRMKYVAMVAIAAAANGLLSCIIKLGLNAGVSLSHLLLSSVSMGFLFFFVMMIICRQTQLSLKRFLSLSVVGLFIGLSAFCYTKSVEYLPASIAVVLQFQFTWIGVLLDAIYRRQWPNLARWLMVGLIFFGTLFAAGLINDEISFVLSPFGIIFGLLCAFSFSLYLFLNNHIEPNAHWSQRSFCTLSGSIFVTLLLVLPGQSLELADSGLNDIFYYGGLMAVIGYAIPISFFAIGIPKIGSAISSLLSACELPVAIIGAMLLLNESVSGLQWLGIGLIFISLLIRDPESSVVH
jgi:drug/metabolite transporter (DMT)-like permease